MQNSQLDGPFVPYFGRNLSEISGASQTPALVSQIVSVLSDPSNWTPDL